MAVKSTAVTVATTATRLDTAVEAVSSTRSDAIAGQGVLVWNDGAATIYLGGSDVTTANGVPVPAGTWSPAIELAELGEGLYGIVASGTVAARVLESGV